jgi:phosphoribosylformimino-5-aminoimidazole carboxamide ribotide isomerase
MIALPAIDLRDGACVQLVGGDFAEERVRVANPFDAAQRWMDAGFTSLHIVDLDAATGKGDNNAMIDELLRCGAQRVIVGGGVRTTERAEALIQAGAAQIIVGTRAISDRAWLEALVAALPDRVIVATDVNSQRIVTHGWQQTADVDVADFVRELDALPLAGILATAVHREGRLGGPDVALVNTMIRASRHPVIASGGITTFDDLQTLSALGAYASVIGMALYTGALDARQVASEYSA